MSTLRIPSIILIASSFLFSVLSIHFALDVSFFAFWLATAFSVITAYFLYKKVFLDQDFSSVKIAEKLLQYIPFVFLAAFILRRAGKYGTPYAYDVVTVLLWCVVFVDSLVILHYLNEKRVYNLNPEWKKFKAKPAGGILVSKKITKKSVIREAVDWIDSIVQAVFMVLLVQIFIFQLYIIPSESMVPAFLIKDRVVVFKTASGPKFPLSDVGLPCLKKYDRGDVVVFRNPHYSIDRKSEVRSVISQIVYMLSLTTINLNKDENGELKADPLVKRICGLPGEQIFMQDGVLYARNASSNEFSPIDFDNKYAAWNLNTLSPAVKRGIEYIPLSESQYNLMLEVEEYRRNSDVPELIKEISKNLAEFKRLYGKNIAFDATDFSEDEFPSFVYHLFAEHATIAEKIMTSSTGKAWFISFLQGALDSFDAYKNGFSGDGYAEANFKLNLMIKTCLSKLYLADFKLYESKKPRSTWSEDESVLSLLFEGQQLNFYTMILDQRNMPVFPKNMADGSASYIPNDCYFMMGDNRFNSLDMRHSYEQNLAPLTTYDSASVTYYSNMAPQYVNKKYILGSASFRFWPLNRAGKIQTR